MPEMTDADLKIADFTSAPQGLFLNTITLDVSFFPTNLSRKSLGPIGADKNLVIADSVLVIPSKLPKQKNIVKLILDSIGQMEDGWGIEILEIRVQTGHLISLI